MKYLYLILFLLLVACSKGKDESTCASLSDTLVVSSEVYPCVNTQDMSSKYKVIAIAGGDTSITDPAAYKADLKSKFQWAKTRSEKVIYFSSPIGMASAMQYAAAQEAVIEDQIPTYDLYSYSISHPWDFPNYISQVISTLP